MQSTNPAPRSRPTRPLVSRASSDSLRFDDFSAGPFGSVQGGVAAGGLAHVCVESLPEGFLPTSIRVDLLRPVPLGEVALQRSRPHESRSLIVEDVCALDPSTGKVLARASIQSLRAQPVQGVAVEEVRAWGNFSAPASCEPIDLAPLRPDPWLMDALELRMSPEGVHWWRWDAPLSDDDGARDWFSRLLAPSDWTHGMLRPGMDPDGVVAAWPNTDLTLHIDRPHVGDWIGTLPRGHWRASGLGAGYSELIDERGVFGRTAMNCLVRAA